MQRHRPAESSQDSTCRPTRRSHPAHPAHGAGGDRSSGSRTGSVSAVRCGIASSSVHHSDSPPWCSRCAAGSSCGSATALGRRSGGGWPRIERIPIADGHRLTASRHDPAMGCFEGRHAHMANLACLTATDLAFSPKCRRLGRDAVGIAWAHSHPPTSQTHRRRPCFSRARRGMWAPIWSAGCSMMACQCGCC